MDDEEGDGEVSARQTPDAENSEPAMKRTKFGKNPNVDTSFLPDREREEDERRERERLRQEWLRRQEELKAEEIEITYSYWDGSGHRKSVIVRPLDQLSELHFSSFFKCKKADTISTFLEKCRQQFPELRGVNVDNLMYVKVRLLSLSAIESFPDPSSVLKEDLIIPGVCGPFVPTALTLTSM